MKLVLNRVGFVGRDAAEVRGAAREQRFNASVLELRGGNAGGAVYVGNRSGFFGHAVARLKDKFFSLVHLKRFEAGDQKAAALTSLREQISDLNVTKPELKEKYLRELDFKISHGLPLRASYYNKAIQKLFEAIDHDTAYAQGSVILPPVYEDVNEPPRATNLAESPSNPETGSGEIPQYRDVVNDRDAESPNGRPVENQAHDMPPPDYEGFLAERNDGLVHDSSSSAVSGDALGIFQLQAHPVEAADSAGAPSYGETTGYANQAMQLQNNVYDTTQRHPDWKMSRPLHRPPVGESAQENLPGALGEQSSRFDLVAGNTEDFYRNCLTPVLEKTGSLPRFNSIADRNHYVAECLAVHKSNYLAEAAKLQRSGTLQESRGYAGIREFLENDLCAVALAGKGGGRPPGSAEIADMRKEIFSPQLTRARAGGIETQIAKENQAIKERLLSRYGLKSNPEAYGQACRLAAAANTVVLKTRSSDPVSSKWFSSHPPLKENFAKAVAETMQFYEVTGAGNGKAMNEAELEMKVFKHLCNQSWENYSGPRNNRVPVGEVPSPAMVDAALRQAWMECTAIGRRKVGEDNLAIYNFLNYSGREESHHYSDSFHNLYRNALVERVSEVDKNSKNYELDCLLKAGDLFTEITDEVSGLSLYDVGGEYAETNTGNIGDFVEDLFVPLVQEIGQSPMRGLSRNRQVDYIKNLHQKVISLVPYKMALAEKAPGMENKEGDLPIVFRQILEKEVARQILNDIGRVDNANDDAYLGKITNLAFEDEREPLATLARENDAQVASALSVMGIGKGVEAGKEALNYLQTLSLGAVRVEAEMRDHQINEAALQNFDILQLAGSEKHIEKTLKHWGAQATAEGRSVTKQDLHEQLFKKVAALSWWNYQHKLASMGGPGKRDIYKKELATPLSDENCATALRETIIHYKELARDGSDGLVAMGPRSFFAYSVADNPFVDNQRAYTGLRASSANNIRKQWRAEMKVGMDDDVGIWLDRDLEFLMKGRVTLRDLLEKNLVAQAVKS